VLGLCKVLVLSMRGGGASAASLSPRALLGDVFGRLGLVVVFGCSVGVGFDGCCLFDSIGFLKITNGIEIFVVGFERSFGVWMFLECLFLLSKRGVCGGKRLVLRVFGV